jgi:diaminohydroxyphosphoribosylaminopyrimidine deaminase/5-amino-6-(5-phosphoribosylamino)uracil reductase
VRIVLDSQLQMPLTSQLVRTVSQAPVVVFCHEHANARQRAALEAAGITVIATAAAPAGLDLNEVLDRLWELRIRSVLCEGGARLAGSLACAGRINQLHVFLAPHLLGPHAISGFAGVPGNQLELDRVQRFGQDVLLTYFAAPSPAPERPGNRA